MISRPAEANTLESIQSAQLTTFSVAFSCMKGILLWYDFQLRLSKPINYPSSISLFLVLKMCSLSPVSSVASSCLWEYLEQMVRECVGTK